VVEDGVAGKGTTDHAGASSAGAAGEGNAQGGKAESAGSANGGKSGGDSAGKGGDESGGASAGTGGGTPQCDCKPPTPVCVNGSCVALGPTQMAAGSKAGGTSFYIDRTEVTNEQYAAFLTAKAGDTSGQRPECQWNDDFKPAAAIGDDPRPAVNVDFCDAVAFCDWAGERLCGSLAGGQVAPSDLRDPTISQWYLACAGPDKEVYPYGNDFVADNCNEYFSGAMADAGKFTKCEGHYTGVLDLVGNAAEWVDSCVADPGGDRSMDTCELMGGSFLRSDFDCATALPAMRSDVAAVNGFRCCSK
jgi:hypothetical protein